MSVERTIGRYEVLRVLGRGGMAVVYLARQTDLGRLVALKELSELRAADPSFAHRFVRESRLAGSLTHPNIVVVHEYFEHEDTAYIAMEYVAGGSLRPYVGRLTQAQIAGVLEGVLAALAHAEGAGIVHRDLKPENLMATDEGRIKITDFGIARASADVQTAFMTATGTALGTPSYMAPEQAMGEDIGSWTDLYATGVLAYEMLSGRLPFPQEEAPMAKLMRHINEPPPHLSTVRSDVDRRLADWVMAMLEKRPEDRPGGADQAWHRLEDILIDVVGPRWRREARLPSDPGTREQQQPLTPAPFESTRARTPEPGPAAGEAEGEQSEFVSYHPGQGAEREATAGAQPGAAGVAPEALGTSEPPEAPGAAEPTEAPGERPTEAPKGREPAEEPSAEPTEAAAPTEAPEEPAPTEAPGGPAPTEAPEEPAPTEAPREPARPGEREGAEALSAEGTADDAELASPPPPTEPPATVAPGYGTEKPAREQPGPEEAATEQPLGKQPATQEAASEQFSATEKAVTEQAPTRGPVTEEAPPDEATEEAPPEEAAGPATRKLPPERPARPPAYRRRRLVALAGLAGLVVAIVIGAIALAGGGGDDEPPEDGDDVEVADAEAVGAPIPVAGMPVGVAVDRGSVFVGAREGERLVELDRDGSEAGTTSLPARAENVVVDSGFAWVTLSGGSEVTAVPLGGGEVATVPVGASPSGITAGDGSLFVSNLNGDTISRFDPDPDAPEVRSSAPGAAGERPHGVLLAAGSLWVTARDSDAVFRLDPDELAPEGDEIPVGESPKGIALAEGTIWVANTESGTVSTIDPATGERQRPDLRVGGVPRGIAVGFGSVWVANGDGYVSRIDPSSREVLQRRIAELGRGASPEEVATGLGRVWVTTGVGDAVARIDPGTERP